MLKNKSPEDINRVNNKDLFTELTPSEAAFIEGGARYQFHFVDTSVEADLCVKVAGVTIWTGKSNEKLEAGLKPLGDGAFSGIDKVEVFASSESGPCGGGDKCGILLGTIPISTLSFGPRLDTFNYKPGEGDPLSGAYTVAGFVNA